MNDTITTLKAFRVDEHGRPRYLFHGIDGSTLVPLDTWVEADIKDGVRDGLGKRYTSGFHSLPDEDVARRYSRRFKTNYPVAKVKVRECRRKPHSREPVVLSRWLFLSSEEWDRALRNMQSEEAA